MNSEFLAGWLKGVDEEARPRAIFGLGVLVERGWELSGEKWDKAKELAAAGPEAIAAWFRSKWDERQRPHHWLERLEWGDSSLERWEALRAIFDAAAVSKAWRELARHAGGSVDLQISPQRDQSKSEAEAMFRWLSEQAWKPGSGVGGWHFFDWRWGLHGRSSWHWPLRLGFLADPRSQALLDQYRWNEVHPWVHRLSVAIEVEHTGLPCDLLLSPLGDAETAEALRRARTRASAVLLVGGESPPPELAEAVTLLSEVSDAATLGFIPGPLGPDFVVELVRHLSHDRFLDAAIARACEGSATPPLMIAGPGEMARMRVSRLGEHWARGLERRGDAAGAALMRSEAQAPYLSEMGTASRILEVASETEARRPMPRYLNAGVWGFDAERPWGDVLEPSPMLRRDAWNVVAVGLGPTRPDAGDEVAPFPDWWIEWDDETHPLTLVLVAPGCAVLPSREMAGVNAGRLIAEPGGRPGFFGPPLDHGDFEEGAASTILAGPTGRSALASFFVRLGAELDVFKARIMVMHGNRVLQTAILEGAIDETASRPRRGGREGRDERPSTIRLRTEGVVRADLQDLDDRRQFDLAILTNDELTGSGQWTAVADDRVVLRDFTDLEGVPERIQKRLQQLVYEPERFKEPGCEAATVVLKQLAHEGVLIREALADAGLGPVLERDPARIQLVSAKPDALLPIEFIYDGLAPDRTATPCPGEAKALARGNCGDCPHRTDRDHVCAMRFWGVRKVIERQLYDPASAPDRDTVAMSPSPDGQLFKRPAMRLFACADRAATHPAGEAAIRTLCARLNGATAETWDEWRERIDADSPGLLLLLPHTESDDYGEYLEIGTDQLLSSAHIARDVVGNEEPVLVLLLGCETAVADISYAKFIGRFRHARASVVIGTLMPVLGRHAAPVAEALIVHLEHYWEQPAGAATVGDAIAAMRRELLQKGLPVGLAVVAIGDADWLIGG